MVAAPGFSEELLHCAFLRNLLSLGVPGQKQSWTEGLMAAMWGWHTPRWLQWKDSLQAASPSQAALCPRVEILG